MTDDNDSQVGGTRKRASTGCKPLLDAATPELFQVNAFRVTGLPVDATARQISKHFDSLKQMAELGLGASVHTGPYALKPPPTLDQIREAHQRLKDPEQRLIDEFFWFWPEQFGKSTSDAAIQALAGGDGDTAFQIWRTKETNPTDGVVAMHNVAIVWYLTALEWENATAKQGLDDERRRKIETYWRDAFKRWEHLATDDTFWEKITSRVKQIDDARLTSGFVRRMRTTLPGALVKVNAQLALRYAQAGQVELARMHVQFMRETNAGLDDIEKIAELVLTPARNRLSGQIQRAQERASKNPHDAATATQELLQQAQQTLSLFDLFFGKDNDLRNELFDELAGVCNRLQIVYHKATSDDKTCLEILTVILPFTTSTDLRLLIEKDISETSERLALEPIRTICDAAAKAAEANPASGDKQAERILSAISHILSKLSSSGLPQGAIDRAKDEIALALIHCAVVFGNKTDKWKPCIAILEQSLQLAVSSDVKGRATKNLDIVRQNNALYRNLTPISSAPSLHTINGIGVTLYGCTDQDPATGSHLATYYFVFLGIPIFPICRYRVASTSNGYRFFGNAVIEKLLRIQEAMLAECGGDGGGTRVAVPPNVIKAMR